MPDEISAVITEVCGDKQEEKFKFIIVDMHGMVCLYAFVPLCRLSLCYVSLICQFVSLPFLC
jgi:hypothetical protein